MLFWTGAVYMVCQCGKLIQTQRKTNQEFVLKRQTLVWGWHRQRTSKIDCIGELPEKKQSPLPKPQTWVLTTHCAHNLWNNVVTSEGKTVTHILFILAGATVYKWETGLYHVFSTVRMWNSYPHVPHARCRTAWQSCSATWSRPRRAEWCPRPWCCVPALQTRSSSSILPAGPHQGTESVSRASQVPTADELSLSCAPRPQSPSFQTVFSQTDRSRNILLNLKVEQLHDVLASKRQTS